MIKRALQLIALLLITASWTAACGEPPDAGTDAGTGGGDVSSGQCLIEGYDGEGTPPPAQPTGDCDDTVVGGPDEPVSDTPGSSDPEPGPVPPPVEPQPGQDNVRAVGWDSVKVLDEDSVKVKFWSGVEPCNVLDHVEVAYETKTVAITLFEGSDSSGPDTACIEIALLKQTIVDLDEPLDGRKIVDGAR